MELVSLDLERFGCVGRAQVTFKTGLNVLHGANEIGKSSIARAIRFALLLPSSSSAVDPWIPWSGGGDPTVTLVFKHEATYHRVKKVFGTNTAVLERSADGNVWTNVARAREVEARLRSLLQWGIPEPGGTKAPRGVPESFLASALLADQDEVASIFDHGLDGDDADSGRVRVRAALQAMAQDPLFKAVLDAAQARVDEAFTTSGQRKRGARDPFKKMADEIATRQRERDEAEKAATDARLLAERVMQLQRQTVAAEGDVQERAAARESLEKRRARQTALARATEERKKAQTLLDAVTEAVTKVKEAEDVLRELEPSIPGLRTTEEETRKAFEAATAEVSAALEKRKTELAQEETAILRERETVRARQTRVDVALDLRKADGFREQGDQLQQQQTTLDDEIAALEAVEPWSELNGATTSLEVAGQREKKAVELMAKAADLRARAAVEWPTPTSTLLPDDKCIAELRQLRHKLDMAEARLDVGLSVEVRGAPSVRVSIDGAAKESKASPFAIEAKKSAALALGTGIEITIRGGQSAHREDAERLRKEWLEATASIFAAVGVADFPALEDACRVEAEKRSRAETLTTEAQGVDAERSALGDPVADTQRLSTRIAELENRLQGADVRLIEALAQKHGSQARVVLTKKSKERESLRTSLANHRAHEAALRERVAASSAAAAIENLDAEVSALVATSQDLDRREEKVASEREFLDTPHIKDDALEDALKSAKKALEEALDKVSTATTARESWNVRLQERRGAVVGDIVALTIAEDAARSAAMNDGEIVDETAITNARNGEETARLHHTTLLGELRKAEGALDASGGAAADEQLDDMEKALRRAHEKQSSLEDDYEAWKLLTETLKEAERNQATHLGNVLAPDLAGRLQALAGQRYSGIALSPHLSLEGIESSGVRRDLDRLSIGTREQLSTLFRLCLAERLRTALLLDDQLVQSDPDRLRWFRRALRQTASTGVQVVVLTCRPDDYLEPTESPAPHVINLGTTVTV